MEIKQGEDEFFYFSKINMQGRFKKKKIERLQAGQYSHESKRKIKQG